MSIESLQDKGVVATPKESQPLEDLVRELVERYKGALLWGRVWRELGAQGRIGPEIEAVRDKHLPQVQALFAEYDQSRGQGIPVEVGLRELLAKLRQALR